ncbi:MAG: hypothetical protein QME16_00035 [Planctomycetota bacterium]|nr:hypothetical protein [Planctomycetota bacterium]
MNGNRKCLKCQTKIRTKIYRLCYACRGFIQRNFQGVSIKMGFAGRIVPHINRWA